MNTLSPNPQLSQPPDRPPESIDLQRVPSADILGELARRYARVVGGRARRSIEQSGLSLSAVAVAADISPDLLAAYLRGERPWLVDDLMQLADVVGVDIMDLLAAGRP